MTSDHRPVFSLFDCQIKKINMEKRSTIQHEITKLSDKKENDFLPNCSVSTNHLLFTPVRFSVPINQSFSLNNIGQVFFFFLYFFLFFSLFIFIYLFV